MDDQYSLIYVSAKDKAQARKITEHLLRRKLVACVSIVENVESHYWWRGKIENETECLMILKTKESLYPTIEKYVTEHHSYEVPEIILVPIKKGYEDYLFWIKKNVENM
ncbi:MAG: divalent-cation tolerance protein CutA [Candidatus Aureabacteria bacterium]|nr:divalent-cation tolerance protein CutA [Candidatus Auribacterota bacterium]